MKRSKYDTAENMNETWSSLLTNGIRTYILDCFFGDINVAEGANQDRDRLAVVLAKQRFDQC